MVRSGVFKIAGAFLAGLVVALGSALLYVQVQDGRTAQIAKIERQPRLAEAPADEPAAEPEPAPAASVPPVVPQAKRTAPAKHGRKAPVVTTRVVRSPEPALPIQVVQNSTPTMPAVYPAISQPAPAQPVPAPSGIVEAPPSDAAPQPHRVELAAGMPLSIRLGETLSTEHNYPGDTFRGTLEQPIIRDGFIIADKGSKVLGRIVDASRAGRVRGVSNLSLTLVEINTTDGQRVRVDTNSVEKRGTSSTGSDAAKIAGGAALGAIIGALGGGGKGAAIGAGAGGAAGTGVVLATRGKPAVLPNESLLTFQLSAPVIITEQLNR